MPSVNSRSMPNVWPSSTFTTPSLPTLSIASAITSPISSSAAEMAATRAIWSLPEISFACSRMFSTAWSTAFSMPRRRASGFAPAATFFRPLRTICWASTVAVVVPSPATSLVAVATSRTSCAPWFWKTSSTWISRAMVTPSLRLVGARRGAELLVEREVAAARAERDLDGVGDGVHAELEGLAGLDVVLQFLVSHVSLNLLRGSASDLGEDVGLAQDQQVLALDRDLGAAVLRVQDLV